MRQEEKKRRKEEERTQGTARQEDRETRRQGDKENTKPEPRSPSHEASPLNSQLSTLSLPHGSLRLPVYLPDATFGVVRSLDAADLEQVGIEALVMNVFHLMQKPGSSTINALGGLHRMAGWTHPIITDSGGFQAYSLVRQNARFGSLNAQGIRFKPEGAEREFQLTPEKSVQLQLAYGADVVICLDDCTNAGDSPDAQRLSVERTIDWAARCKAEFARQMQARGGDEEKKRRKEAKKQGTDKKGEGEGKGESPQDEAFSYQPSTINYQPLLFGVVQGGGQAELRRECAERLLEIGFDGYGYGGWPLDENGSLLIEMLQATREAIPAGFPMHALGIGSPDSVVRCARLGYGLFDCALPTRDARNGRLYVWKTDPGARDFGVYETEKKEWLDTLYIDDEKHTKVAGPLSPFCDCPVCLRYSTGYVRHLRKIGETLYFRLATLHNLRFMARLMAAIRAGRGHEEAE